MILALIVMSVALAAVIAGGYRLRWKWAGLSDKTFWDWLQLLIVPGALAGVALVFSQWQNSREEMRADQRGQIERELAVDAQRDQTLQNYLDGMSELMLDKELRSSTPRSEIRTVARTRTLSVVRRLDGERKGILLRFLAEAKLIAHTGPVIRLALADLSGAKLNSADLRKTNLDGVDLSQADLRFANLDGSSLVSANLDQARLDQAHLEGIRGDKASFQRARMDRVVLIRASLQYAKFDGAALSGAYLGLTDMLSTSFKDAQLDSADFHSAKMTRVSFLNAEMRFVDMSQVVGESNSFRDTNLRDAKSFDPARLPGSEFMNTTMPYGRTCTARDCYRPPCVRLARRPC